MNNFLLKWSFFEILICRQIKNVELKWKKSELILFWLRGEGRHGTWPLEEGESGERGEIESRQKFIVPTYNLI